MPDRDDRPPALRPFWSGTLSFGLVSVPVALYAGNRKGGVSLRTLGPDGTPLSRRYYCPEEGVEVSYDEIVRGYETDSGEMVVVEDDELERLAPEKSRDIDLRRFVPRDELDPRYFDRAYFLTPAGDSTKAYRLLARVMENTGRAGIATFVMRGKEYLVALLAEDGILRAETLRFHDEIRSPADVGLPEKEKPPAGEVRALKKAISGLKAKDLDREELEDDYAERIEALAQKKRQRGEGVVAAPEEAAETGDVPDLMKVLKWSLRKREDREEQREREIDRPAREDLEERSKTELYQQAQDLAIPGRSKMSKGELIQAIRRSA